MKEPFKLVNIDGTAYRIGRLTPEVGSFFLMKLMGTMIASVKDSPASEVSAEPSKEKPNPEDLARSVIFGAFFNNSDFDLHSTMQRRCLAACSRMESDIPMPVAAASGVIALPEVRDDATLVMRLEVEVLVFNLSPFFEGEKMKALSAGASAIRS